MELWNNLKNGFLLQGESIGVYGAKERGGSRVLLVSSLMEHSGRLAFSFAWRFLSVLHNVVDDLASFLP